MSSLNFKYQLFFVFGSFLFSSCFSPPPEATISTVKDYNMLVVPDLSNRIDQNLYPKPVHDTVLINQMLGHLKTYIGLNHRKTGQKDVYKLDVINKGILSTQVFNPSEMTIDLRRFENNALERSNYLRNDLAHDVVKFRNGVKTLYDYALVHPSGADVWNYFNESIKRGLEDTARVQVLNTPEQIVYKQTKNVALLLTDGYIESANKEKGYLLNDLLIHKIRKDYHASGRTDLREFVLSNPDYFIKETAADKNELNVMVCEVIDRSLDKNGAATVQPTDFQILEILWTKWLKDAGCDKIKILQAVKSKEQFAVEVEQFLKSL